jgi:hypothetical protein
MKKLATFVFALLLGASLSFAQAGGSTTSTDAPKTETKKKSSKKKSSKKKKAPADSGGTSK